MRSKYDDEIKVRRVQKYVETLDMLKIKNSMSRTPHVHSNGLKSGLAPSQQQTRQPNGHSLAGHQHQQLQQQPPPKQGAEQQPTHSTSGTVVTTKWETFDSAPPLIPVHSAASTAITNDNSVQPKFNWELFE